MRVDDKIKSLVNFNILEQEQYRVLAQLTISPDLPSFKGHFPNNPILPAVSIIDISLYLLSYLQVRVSYTKVKMKKSKFAGRIGPGQVVEISATSDDGTSWTVVWSAEADKTKLAQLILVF